MLVVAILAAPILTFPHRGKGLLYFVVPFFLWGKVVSDKEYTFPLWGKARMGATSWQRMFLPPVGEG